MDTSNSRHQLTRRASRVGLFAAVSVGVLFGFTSVACASAKTGIGSPVASSVSAQLGGAAKIDIAVKSLKFTPKKATVKKGQLINFVWKESVAHNIVIDKTHKSPTLNKGTWTTKFDKSGTYKYKCTLHPGMDGEITVK